MCNQYNKKNDAIEIRALKHALDHGLAVEKFHKVIEFKQKNIVEAIHWYEHRILSKRQERFWEDLSQFYERSSFSKDYWKY